MNNNSTKKSSYNPYVFFGSIIFLVLLVFYTAVFKNQAQSVLNSTKIWINTNFSWFYVLVVAIILVTTVFIFLSRVGDIKLGPDHSKPEFSTLSWLSMLFAAGMGIGLMFWGVAEPVMHYLTPPDADPGSIKAAREAMVITFFHWGLNGWAIYVIVATILGYFSFRHGLPLTLRSALYPLIGERIYGPIGNAVDTFAVIGTVLGVATTLGMGVKQINAGLHHLYGVPISFTVQFIFIVVIMFFASLSVFSGLSKGVKRLSEANMILAVLMLLFVLILGPTLFIMTTFMQNIGDYLSEIVSKSFNLYAYKTSDWIGNWTIFYWAWWLAWSPFVGAFIARISRGRTVRQLVMGALFAPTLLTVLWMTVFGDTALHLIVYQGVDSLAEVVRNDYSMALFAFLEHFPLSSVTSLIAVIMVIVFFVTSADSAAIIVDMFCSDGKTDTPVWQSLFWAGMMAAVTIALMYADGISALQAAIIIGALPFSIALLAAIWGLIRGLHLDATRRDIRRQSLNISRPAPRSTGGWQRRLRNLTMFTRRSHVVRFIEEVVKPACEEVAEELNKQGSTAIVVVNEAKNTIRLELAYNDKVYFAYEVRPRHYPLPEIITRIADDDEGDSLENRNYFRADVHLLEGGQDYDIMGWSKEDVIGDIIDQYETHLHFLHIVRANA
ncbi:BCCT family transporter [Entomomonas asaccharolytica]|uniref:Choline BCCT transporter BetT n=1 Tax=Entomomonas asaccharolytica TaxID=2785331 RepID=A0A974NDT5_9GAMM|nr:choline BCCT transporter BetT [Entomomonas asaccharolytica]QQP84683.1 choline BCCT transporter BetT [Entomomonas asaccharolytica]